MYDIESEIIVCNSTKTKDIKDIDKAIDSQELEKLQEDYFVFSSRKMENEEYSQADLEKYMALLEEHFYKDGVITCPYVEDGNVTDHLTLISKLRYKINKNTMKFYKNLN